MNPFEMSITNEISAQIRAEANATYPHEGCGALLGRWVSNELKLISAIALPNVATLQGHQGQDRFVIDPKAYAALEQRLSTRGDVVYGLTIMGFFHSHPNGKSQPSLIDLEMAQGLFQVTRTFYIYAIISVCGKHDPTGALEFWKLNSNQQAFVNVQPT